MKLIRNEGVQQALRLPAIVREAGAAIFAPEEFFAARDLSDNDRRHSQGSEMRSSLGEMRSAALTRESATD